MSCFLSPAPLTWTQIQYLIDKPTWYHLSKVTRSSLSLLYPLNDYLHLKATQQFSIGAYENKKPSYR